MKQKHTSPPAVAQSEQFIEAPPSQEPSLLKVSGLSKTFWMEQRRIQVLQDLDFEIKAREMIAVIGASGAGKSTLLHLLGTLDAPTHGQIQIDGRDILQMEEEELAAFRNKTIGFVFQAHYLLPEFSALENVMMPALIHRMDRNEARERAHDLLKWVGLSERTTHRPGELSGGERQRVALSRALIMRPKLLLADEPTGNLDESTGAGIHDLLSQLNEKWGTTTIVVTHNLQLARQMQRCFQLEQGKLLEKTYSGDETIEG